MKFIFEWRKQYFTNERSKRVKYCFYHEKINFISSSHRVMFFLLYSCKQQQHSRESTQFQNTNIFIELNEIL